MTSAWVFGYGSLVSPASVARTIGRPVRADGFASAWLDGFGRRWNYGSLRQRADWDGPHGPVTAGVVVCLGLAPSAGERCNGAVIAVSDDELALLDRRESDYDRVEVTELVTVDGDRVADRHVTRHVTRVVTYVPRPSAVARYRAARDQRRAAVRASYATLVEQAMAAMGDVHRDHYRASTPPPDVPVLELG